MKKILISARDLKIGGIEKSLITLTNYLIREDYQITLALETKQGELINKLNSKIKIIEYKPCSTKFILLRKAINILKRIWFIFKYKNKFDISISFTTYSQFASFAARTTSKKAILWCHADYLEMFNGNKQKVKKFFSEINFNKFSKIIFVSNSAKESFLKVFQNKENTFFCNNLIDSEEILQKAEDKINIKYNSDVTTFLNVGRHDEHQKKLTRIIESALFLKNNGYKFRIIFVGSGQDTLKYKQLVEEYELQNYVIFAGAKENPYPYFKISDCVVLSSDYEGYPVVFLESYILNKPIITTDISDYQDIQNKRGIVVEKSENGIYEAMKFFIKNGYTIKEKFNEKKYNTDIKKILEKILI